MDSKQKQSQWPTLWIIAGVTILAIFVFRSLYLISASEPVYDADSKIVGMKPSPRYDQYKKQQLALGVTGGLLTITGISMLVIRRCSPQR